MNEIAIRLMVFACVFGSALLGMFLRAVLPERHLSPETKDTVRLGMGLIVTMSALVLGLLIASAKGIYDSQMSGLTQMSAKVVLLDRILAITGQSRRMLAICCATLLPACSISFGRKTIANVPKQNR